MIQRDEIKGINWKPFVNIHSFPLFQQQVPFKYSFSFDETSSVRQGCVLDAINDLRQEFTRDAKRVDPQTSNTGYVATLSCPCYRRPTILFRPPPPPQTRVIHDGSTILYFFSMTTHLIGFVFSHYFSRESVQRKKDVNARGKKKKTATK